MIIRTKFNDCDFGLIVIFGIEVRAEEERGLRRCDPVGVQNLAEGSHGALAAHRSDPGQPGHEIFSHGRRRGRSAATDVAIPTPPQ
jgi:hypothetical protein